MRYPKKNCYTITKEEKLKAFGQLHMEGNEWTPSKTAENKTDEAFKTTKEKINCRILKEKESS